MSAIKHKHTLALYLHLLNLDFPTQKMKSCVQKWLWKMFKPYPLHSISFDLRIFSSRMTRKHLSTFDVSESTLYVYIYVSRTLPIAERAIRQNNKWNAAYTKCRTSSNILWPSQLSRGCGSVAHTKFAHGHRIFHSCVYFDGAIRAQYSNTMLSCSQWKCRTLDFYGLWTKA